MFLVQQPLSKRQVIQSPDLLGNLLTNSLQFINIFPILRCLKQSSLFQMSTNKCWREGHDHFYVFTVYPIISTAQRILWVFLATRAHCCIMSSLLSTKIPGPFPQSCFPAVQSSGCIIATNSSFPCARLHICPQWIFLTFLLAHSSSLSRFLWKATFSSSVIDRSSQFGVPWKCECTLSLLFLQ